jgi:colicin import membrane protein
MRPRQRRNIGTNRKAIGAALIAGVLVVGGVTGVRFANASTNTEAAGVIVVDGQQFDVGDCEELEVNAGDVVCDGTKLEPVRDKGADAAAQASAVALEAACDQFAADAAAAENEGGAGDEAGDAGDAPGGAGEKQGGAAAGQGAGKDKAAAKAAAKKWANALKSQRQASRDNAGQGKGAQDKGAQGKGGAGKGAAGAGDEDLAANVVDAQRALLQACLLLADAKGAAGDAGDAGDQADDQGAGGADDQADDEQAGGANDQQGAVDDQQAADHETAAEISGN